MKDGKPTVVKGALEAWDIDRRVRLWSEELRPQPPGFQPATPPWHSADGSLIVVAGDDRNSTFVLKDACSGKELGRIDGPTPPEPLLGVGLS